MADNTISKPILVWFRQYGRHHLPWQTNNIYHIWLSEIMLQQTQVATVLVYFKRFITQFPDIITLANASDDQVMKIWAGLGYYARARNLHQTAQIIRDDYEGHFPSEFKEVIALPGIGKSTAGAILSLGFCQHHPILDGNVKRVLSRYHQIKTPIEKSNTIKHLWQLAKQHTPKQHTNQYTQAIMDLGATICTTSMPKCVQCPLSKHCLGFKNNTQAQLPVKLTKKIKPTKSTVMLAIVSCGQILLQKRQKSGIWGGLWSLPECTESTIIKQLSDFNIQAIQPQKLYSLTHTFTHYHLDITVYLILTHQKFSLISKQKISNHTWYDLTNITCGMPKPVTDIIGKIAQYETD